MPSYTRPEAWQTSGGIRLEKNAWTVLRSDHNSLVIAGPGAGKTELLAQRACYLLQTDLCPEPMRILAISFKHDASANLRDRVRLRCGPELSSRFDSYTFDAFAKNLLDRFREGLPDGFRPPAGYDVETDAAAFSQRVHDIRSRLQPPEGIGSPRSLSALQARYFVSDKLCAQPIDPTRPPEDVVEWGVWEVWRELITANPCAISFEMIKRLAAFMLEANPLLLRALRATYSHVFVDEYQDTTQVQYDLMRTCFQGSNAVITAVGDSKQRIMVWAGAMRDAFSRYESDFLAQPTRLLLNHRSDSELVRIQQFLINAIDPQSELISASEDNQAGDGICQILLFKDAQQEAEHLAGMVSDLIAQGVRPRDICILARRQPQQYCETLIPVLTQSGIKCRVEVEYQDVLGDELANAVLSLLRLAVDIRRPESWEDALQLVCLLAAVDPDDDAAVIACESRLGAFLADLRDRMESEPLPDLAAMKLLISDVVSFYGPKALRAYFPKYRNQKSYRWLLNKLSELLWHSYGTSPSWSATLDDFEGTDAIPAMTIHKSKGLEYHTVFFIGLEDRAWIRFAEEQEEHTCAFFVAFSRAKKQAYFTYSNSRPGRTPGRSEAQSRTQVTSLYNMLLRAGVQEIGVA